MTSPADCPREVNSRVWLPIVLSEDEELAVKGIDLVLSYT